jgi:hypothetical protein
VFDVAPCEPDVSLGVALYALDASPDAALSALGALPDVVAACRLVERQLGPGSALGPQLGIPLAPRPELTKPTWRAPERKKSVNETEFAFHFFHSWREVLPFVFFTATAGRSRHSAVRRWVVWNADMNGD